jgi:hypothetical protein
MHANYQLTNEIASFIINYSNKALSNQRPVPKSGNYSGALMPGSNFVRSEKIEKIFKN